MKDKFNILISPFCKNIGKPHPKDYPFFKELIEILRDKYKNLHFCQIGMEGEEIIPSVNEICQGLPLQFLIHKLQKEVNLVISVDNMIQHLCWAYKIPCICIFTKSDPDIFGHEENTNYLKDRKYLSSNQFDQWIYQDFDKEAFIDPSKISIDKFYALPPEI